MILILAPLVACLLISGWFSTGVFVLWIACLMAAVLVACIIVLLCERIVSRVVEVYRWLKALRP